MSEKIIIAGAGGQGIMLLGKVLAQAAMRQDKFVTWLPAYGAEVRGGTAHCMVIISDQEIGSPYIEQADALIIMNGPSLDKFKDRIKKNGLFIINSSLVSRKPASKANILQYPFTDLAIELGNIKIANMVALGCYIAGRKLISQKNIFQIFEDIAPADRRDLIEINQQAILKGMELVK